MDRHHLFVAALLIAACSEDDTIEHQDKLANAAEGLNKACTVHADCAPPQGGMSILTCGDAELEQGKQCVIEGCPSKGPGTAHGCPQNAFCYVFDGGEGHYCTRICDEDADCQAINPALRCAERSATEDFGLKICIRDDW